MGLLRPHRAIRLRADGVKALSMLDARPPSVAIQVDCGLTAADRALAALVFAVLASFPESSISGVQTRIPLPSASGIARHVLSAYSTRD